MKGVAITFGTALLCNTLHLVGDAPVTLLRALRPLRPFRFELAGQIAGVHVALHRLREVAAWLTAVLVLRDRPSNAALNAAAAVLRARAKLGPLVNHAIDRARLHVAGLFLEHDRALRTAVRRRGHNFACERAFTTATFHAALTLLPGADLAVL